MSRTDRLRQRWHTGRQKHPLTGFTLVEIMIVVAIIGILLSIALPNFARARARTRYTSCIANLHQIQGAKEHWAMENNKADDTTPTDSDLFGAGSYIAVKPQCPVNGTYTLNNIGTAPRCSIGGIWPHRID